MSTDRSVRGVCPACGTALLFLGNGGHVTCSLHDCPDPVAADRLLFHSRAVVGVMRETRDKAPGIYLRTEALEMLDELRGAA